MTGQHLIAKTRSSSENCVHMKLLMGCKQEGTLMPTLTGWDHVTVLVVVSDAK
jgi:hypothetical protein